MRRGDGTSHLDARLTLATVEKQMGNADEARGDEALRVLSMGEYVCVVGQQDRCAWGGSEKRRQLLSKYHLI